MRWTEQARIALHRVCYTLYITKKKFLNFSISPQKKVLKLPKSDEDVKYRMRGLNYTQKQLRMMDCVESR